MAVVCWRGRTVVGKCNSRYVWNCNLLDQGSLYGGRKNEILCSSGKGRSSQGVCSSRYVGVVMNGKLQRSGTNQVAASL